MKAWDIFTYDPGFGDHPAVIVSHPMRVQNKPALEVVLCSSQRARRRPDSNEVLLDAEDGLDWETLCKCDLIWSVEKSALHTFRGTVSDERTRLIIRTIVLSHGWAGL